MSLASLLAAFLRRDTATQVSYRADLVLQLMAIIVTLALFFYLGRLVDDTTLAQEAGFDRGYFAFAVVGIALLRIVQTGLTSFASRLRQDQLTGTLEALMAAPAPPPLVILFSATFDLLRATALAVILVLAAIAFFGLALTSDAAGIAAALLALLLSLVLFGALGVLLAAFTIVFKQTAAVLGLAVTVLALLGGVYFPIDLMPAPLRIIGEVLPFTWAVDAMREALLAGSVDLGLLARLAGSAAIALPLALWVFDRALRRARRDGSLAQY